MRAISNYPLVVEDLAFEVMEDVTAREALDAIRRGGGKLVAEVELFDIYRGAPLPDNAKSLAYRVTYQSAEGPLSEKEVAQLRQHALQGGLIGEPPDERGRVRPRGADLELFEPPRERTAEATPHDDLVVRTRHVTLLARSSAIRTRSRRRAAWRFQVQDRRFHRVERCKHPCDRARTGIGVIRQQTRVALGDMENDRSSLEQGEVAFLIGRNLPERMQRQMRRFLHRMERNKANLIGLAHFFKRPANPRIARQPPAAIG